MGAPKGFIDDPVPAQQGVSDQVEATPQGQSPPELKPIEVTGQGGNPPAIKRDSSKTGPNGEVDVFYGLKAQKKVRALLGRKLTKKEKRVVKEEGYVEGEYYDSKGIVTAGVGQTGEFIAKGFEASITEHEDRVRGLLPDYDLYPEYLQEELLQSVYRGDITLSGDSQDFMNAGEYKKASVEFLDHKEYKKKSTPAQIKARIKSVSDAMAKYGKEMEP